MANFDDRLARIKTLIEDREKIDAELASYLGEAPKRQPQKCGNCGQEGHSARTCPSKSQE